MAQRFVGRVVTLAECCSGKDSVELVQLDVDRELVLKHIVGQ